MTTATDRFAEFLSTMVETLEAGSAQRARRLNLSRHHLDRIVSATGGEPPERMRRRLMLERSAYRLVSSDAEILQVALEAGYSSHEAFTRAFRRAYGQPPSRWRRHPSRTQVGSPSGVHFHPPGGLSLPTTTKVTTMDLVTRMVEHNIWLTGEMLQRAARLPDGVLDEPLDLPVETIDPNPTIRSVLARIVGQLAQWNAAVEQRGYDWDAERTMSLTSLRRRLDVEGPAFLAHLHDTIAEQRLDDTFIDVTCQPPRVFTYGGMIAHVVTFAAVRRLLVLGALERHGITDLDAGDPAHWVASS